MDAKLKLFLEKRLTYLKILLGMTSAGRNFMREKMSDIAASDSKKSPGTSQISPISRKDTDVSSVMLLPRLNRDIE